MAMHLTLLATNFSLLPASEVPQRLPRSSGAFLWAQLLPQTLAVQSGTVQKKCHCTDLVCVAIGRFPPYGSGYLVGPW